MTATVTRIGIPDANSATSSAAAEATMVEPVPLIAEWVEHGFVQINDAQGDTLTAIETAVQICSKAAQASTTCHLRLVEMAYANADALFGLWRELMSAQTAGEFIEKSADAARRQADTAAAQLRELSGLAGKVAAETAEPISANLSRVLKQAA